MRRRELRLVYTITEAADLLGIGRSTAYELAARGELPTVRIGRRAVVTRPTLTELAGIEPPLPCELDAARNDWAKPATPSEHRAPQPSTDQPHLPFGA